MIRILIIDDSPTEILLLKSILESDPDIKVIGSAKSGREGVRLAESLNPDLITMDIHMPDIDGFEATRLIMSNNPKPIIVISSAINKDEVKMTFAAMEAGALDVLEKPKNVTGADFYKEKKIIIETVRNMSEIKVFKRRFFVPHKTNIEITNQFISKKSFELIAIGVSIGGPQALKLILSQLPHNFPLPIVVVQHIAPGFIDGFVSWLNEIATVKIKIADNNERLKGGMVYFAPDQFHLTIEKKDGFYTAKLVDTAPVSGFKPSATVLLESIAKNVGPHAIGALLTGMGNDGALGLLALKNAGGHTFTQDAESAVVFGMAGVAQSLNAVDKIVSLDQIAAYLVSLTNTKSKD